MNCIWSLQQLRSRWPSGHSCLCSQYQLIWSDGEVVNKPVTWPCQLSADKVHMSAYRTVLLYLRRLRVPVFLRLAFPLFQRRGIPYSGKLKISSSITERVCEVIELTCWSAWNASTTGHDSPEVIQLITYACFWKHFLEFFCRSLHGILDQCSLQQLRLGSNNTASTLSSSID